METGEAAKFCKHHIPVRFWRIAASRLIHHHVNEVLSSDYAGEMFIMLQKDLRHLVRLRVSIGEQTHSPSVCEGGANLRDHGRDIRQQALKRAFQRSAAGEGLQTHFNTVPI